MSGDGYKGARPTGSILGDDTPDAWAEDSNPEAHTEFEFSPPTPQRAKRPDPEPPPPEPKPKAPPSEVEALLDQVIDEAVPPPETDEVPLPDAYSTEEMPELSRPPTFAPKLAPPDDNLATNRVEIPKTLSQRPKVPVGRDTQTEMFDGEAASLQRAIDASFGDKKPGVRIPEELTPEVRAVSKVLMGRTGPGADADVPAKPTPTAKKAPTMPSLTDDLVLGDDAGTPVPATQSILANAPPPKPPPRPVAPVSSPSGAELDAVADAFDLEPSEPSHPAADASSGLELAYDPQRPAPKFSPSRGASAPSRPSNAALKTLDAVEPTAMATTTKILIAFAVVLVAVAVVAFLR
ncbi:MAG: hypothetical protein RMA76_13365 [Deltaproteobacteria bacterium]